MIVIRNLGRTAIVLAWIALPAIEHIHEAVEAVWVILMIVCANVLADVFS